MNKHNKPSFQYPQTHWQNIIHCQRCGESIIPVPIQIQTEHYTLPEVWSAVGPLFQYPHKYTDRTLLTARGVVSSGSSARGGGWPFSPQPIKGVGPILSPCAVVTVEVASNTSLSWAEIKECFKSIYWLGQSFITVIYKYECKTQCKQRDAQSVSILLLESSSIWKVDECLFFSSHPPPPVIFH